MSTTTIDTGANQPMQGEQQMNTNIMSAAADLPFGIRCTRDGTGRLPPAVAWFKELGEVQSFATLAEAERVASSLNASALPCCRYEARAFAQGLGEAPLAPPPPVAPAGPNVTTAQFVKWACANKGLAEAVCRAKAFAQVERERVHKYILPLLASFEFIETESGKKITDPDKLYLCEDETRKEEFYDRADEAHRANGFIGEPRVWPDLQADTLHTYAENQLIDSACNFFGLERQPIGKKREQFAKLVLSACLNAPSLASAAGKLNEENNE